MVIFFFAAINDTLEVLDLSWNHIRRMGALAICKGLQVFNSKLLLGVVILAKEQRNGHRHYIPTTSCIYIMTGFLFIPKPLAIHYIRTKLFI